MQKKTFELRAILQITTGIMMRDGRDGGVDDLYDVLNFMMQDELYTHALPWAAKEATPWIEAQLPFVKNISVPGGKTVPEYEQMLAAWNEQYGEHHELHPIPKDDQKHPDQIQMLHELVGEDRVVVVEFDDDGNPSDISTRSRS